MRGCHLCQPPCSGKVTYFFGEPFIESKRWEVLGDPRLGVALVTGVHPVGFTTVLCGEVVNRRRLSLVDRTLPQQSGPCEPDARDHGGTRFEV